MDEIYGVTDKLSREWKLWTWTQQNEFLDSSTKQMKMSDSLSFTNSVEFGSISNEDPTHSTQYLEMDMEKNNEIWQSIYNILNSLDNPSTQNAYRLIWNWSEGKPDVVGSASNQNGNTSASDGRLETLVDINSDSDASRYVDFSEYFATWLDKQWQLWTQIYDYISNLDTYTVMLLNKRCE